MSYLPSRIYFWRAEPPQKKMWGEEANGLEKTTLRYTCKNWYSIFSDLSCMLLAASLSPKIPINYHYPGSIYIYFVYYQ